MDPQKDMLYQKLRHYWKYDSFRPLQEEIIRSVLSGHDTLALLPTGGGKSICYQLPALMKEGLCLVISPLVALMQDQVLRLKELGIPALALHSGMNFAQLKEAFEALQQDQYKLLYVAPERIQTYLFRQYLPSLSVSLIAVDEAHCISQWGHDFRPGYLKIASLREECPGVPFLALTASATSEVVADITQQLQFRNPAFFSRSFRRENIFYSVQYSEQKAASVCQRIMRIAGSSITYCRSRRQTEQLSRILDQEGIAALHYHAGMPRREREKVQKSWMQDEVKAMVATTAFGMGIDKPDVRIVLHYDAPEHLESWYQEAGRAGRDGQASYAWTFYNQDDINRLEESTGLHYPPETFLRQVYQSIAEYFQIPIGGQPEHYLDFDIADFCTKFKLPPVACAHALKLLEREGLWTITESVYAPTTVQFTTDRQTLDELYNFHPELAYICTTLLRMYGGIFHYPTAVRLGNIARQLRTTTEEIEKMLHRLDRMGMLVYNKPKDSPQIFFQHIRADSRFLLLNKKRIDLLRTRHEARTKAMIRFLENTTVCRERLFLQYFGEPAQEDCGHCDVCREKKRQGKDYKQELKKRLWDLLQAQNPVTLESLLLQLQEDNAERIIELLREWTENESLSWDDRGILILKKTD